MLFKNIFSIKLLRKLLTFFFIANFVSFFSFSQNVEPPTFTSRILFILDASGSMHGNWDSGVKIDVAKNLLGEFLDSLESRKDKIELALRVYGHQSPRNERNCKDTKLEVPFAPKNAVNIKNRLKTIIPKGQTPIGYSLLQAAKDFPADPYSRNLIILITDGIESCSQDPCEVSVELQKKGIILKPFIIGVGLETDYSKALGCIGNFYDAATEEIFKTVMNVVISQALNTTTAQVNLLDITGNATETNVNMTFYDAFSNNIKYNLIHTLNDRGNPDTVSIDPALKYKLVVHTIPFVTRDSIELMSGKHNIIAVDAPQGNLELKIDIKSGYKNLQSIIRLKDNTTTLNVQDFNSIQKYITGKYDLEILTLPRIMLNDVEVLQSHTTTIQIPQPGYITITNSVPGFGSIYTIENKEIKWVINLDESKTSSTYMLQPGIYKVVFRPKNAKQSCYTIEKNFEIIPGSGSSVVLY